MMGFDLSALLGLLVLAASATIWLWQGIRRRNAAQWPTAQGHVAHVHVEQIADDRNAIFAVVTLTYTYTVENERYVGRECFSFHSGMKDAARFKAGCKDRTVPVHIGATNPACQY